MLATAATPTEAHERILLLDGLRAFGLFGIFVVNIVGSYAARPPQGVDRVADQLVHILATDSFYPLFSMLFGIGFASFLDRAAARGGSSVRLFLRRAVALGMIGVLQFVLLEPRDILLRYAVLSLPLLTFRKAGNRTLLAWAAVLLAIFAVHGPLVRGIERLGGRGELPGQVAQTQAVEPAASAQGQYALRLSQIASYRPTLSKSSTLFHILACFLLGLYVWQQGIIQDPARYRRLLRLSVVWGGIIGLLGKTLAVEGAVDAQLLWGSALKGVASQALTFCYAGGLALLSLDIRWRSLLASVAPMGRMGLTNYLLQSVVMWVLFSSYLFDLAPPRVSECVGIAVLSSIVQVPMSGWWLRRFRFGPVEWLWRTVTYGRRQPMRSSSVLAGAAL